MPQHYDAATVARLLEAANAVLKTRDRTMVLRVVNGLGRENSRAKVAQKIKGSQALTC